MAGQNGGGRSEIAAEGLRRIAEIYAVEKDIRGSSPDQRLSARQARSAPLVASFGEWLMSQNDRTINLDLSDLAALLASLLSLACPILS